MFQLSGQSTKISGLLLLCLCVGACSQETETSGQSSSDRCEASIQSVINLEFTAPDEELVRIEQELFHQMEEDLGDSYGLVEHPGYEKGDPELEELYTYSTETYEPYFSEKGLAEFTQSDWPDAFKFHRSNLDYQLEPAHTVMKEIEIEAQDEGFSAFEFSINVKYQAGSAEASYYGFEGWAICTPEGQITHVNFLDRDSLYDQLEEDTYE